MKQIITNNIGLKIVALGLAIIIWIYVNGELKELPTINRMRTSNPGYSVGK